ncbi:helix-turn-helix domain-containing protein [Nocardiopsis halophila]|uniref:helix-turn-helix domain-containing protein n=1 Tax=Nocardiopsis halophila TaxID=141692 RepID=UPI00037AA12D|nr:helix-turn-helix domain-containing protein [Nocardiopsis halophila]
MALDDVVGRDAARMSERLNALSSGEERLVLVETWLARRRADRSETERSEPDPEVSWTWHRMATGQGAVHVEGLVSEVGRSRKRLWPRSRAQIGLPPKRAARLVRFDHAAHLLAAGRSAARGGADSGYTDQPHLHRDVMAFAAVPPGEVPGEPWLAIGGAAWPVLPQRAALPELPAPRAPSPELSPGRIHGELGKIHNKTPARLVQKTAETIDEVITTRPS